MYLPAVGERAAELPWIWPDTHSLMGLTESFSPATWLSYRRDPGALILILRHLSPFADPPTMVPERSLEPRILETSLEWLQSDRGSWIDWRQPAILPIYQATLAVAHRARILARMTSYSNEFAAWTAGMFVGLGWFAIAAIDPSWAAACRSDSLFASDPVGTQRAYWGFSGADLARSLIHRWRLPKWLDVPLTPIEQNGNDAASVCENRRLFAIVQLAVTLADREGHCLGLASGLNHVELQQSLGLSVAHMQQAEEQFQALDLSEAFEPEWSDPRESSWLPVAILGAIHRRRTEASPYQAAIERDLVQLRDSLDRLQLSEEERLRNEKLAALAEFAAGASHEINNPLAVISGQSQYVLKGEIEEPHRCALESIVRQTQRIHAILAELMLYARPPKIHSQRTSISQILSAVADAYRGLANEFGVRLDCPPLEPAVFIEGDSRQLQIAVGCLIRNAIEAAAKSKGWVQVGVRTSAVAVEIQVDDNGPGPNPAQREHLFDPFFSGRNAGRGRGLGLSTAWRLAHEHGGDVRHEPLGNGPTRFVLTLPLPTANAPTELLIA